MSLSIGTVLLTLTEWVLAGLWLLPRSLLALRRLASVRRQVDLRPCTKAAVFMRRSMCMNSQVAADSRAWCARICCFRASTLRPSGCLRRTYRLGRPRCSCGALAQMTRQGWDNGIRMLQSGLLDAVDPQIF